MADSNCKGDASASSSPQLIFIRLRKDKSKDEIEDEIFKFVTEVWQRSCEKRNVSANDKNCISLLDLDSRTIRQVAVGPEYVGVLLTDGRVCRFKCVSQNTCASSKPPNSQTSVDSLSFHVSSDEVASSTISVASPICVGSTTSSAPVASPLTSGTVESRTVEMSPSKTSHFTSNLAEYPKTGEVKPIDSTCSSTRAKQSEIPTKELQTKSGNVSFASQLPVSVSKSSSEVTAGNSCVSGPSCSNISTGDTDRNGRGKKTKIAKVALQDSGNQRQEVSLGRCYGQVPNGNNVVQSSTTASLSYALNTRRSVSSPTLLQRTVFTRNVPGLSYIVPAVSCVSFPAYLTTCPTIPARLQPHIVRAQLATAGAFPRGPVTAATVHRREDQNADNKPLSCSDDNFCYPVAGILEWLEVEAGTEVAFSHITAMHSDFLLVEKGTGILYHWPYEIDVECDVSMDISSACANLRHVPVAKPHPLGEMLGLDCEQVHIIASCNVRCSLVTSSGKMCTFYDKLLRESNCGEPPALVQELSHSAMKFAEFKGEKIQSVSCSEFFTSVLTQSGKIFWWGLLPTEERQTFKQKLNKATNEASNITVDEKVQLRQHFPGFPGALVYRSCDLRGPLVGRLIGHESPEGNSTAVTKIRVELLNQIVGTNLKCPSTVVQNVLIPESTVSTIVNSPRSHIEEELRENHRDTTRSFSPHTSVKSRAQSSNKSGSGSEIWEVKDVVFLESENKPLGTVVAIDGQHVIVKVANTLSPAESSLRVFKISELEPVPTISDGLEGAALNQQLPPSSLYRGCIQHTPKCIVGRGKSGNKELLAGMKPVAMTTTSLGISVLTQRSLDGKSFFLGPATEQASDSSKVYTCSSDVNISNSNDDGSCTVEAEATPSQAAALGPICTNVSWSGQQNSFAGRKRRMCAGDEDSDSAQPVSPDLNDVSCKSMSSGSLVPCNFHSSSYRYPLLHSASGFDIVLLTDASGCLYPRPYGIKLSSPSIGQVAPVQSLALGTRLGVGSAEGSSSAERMLMVFIAFQEQPLLQAVQSGLLFKIKETLSWLEQLNNSKDIGKGSKGAIKGTKKIAISNNQGKIQEEIVEQFVPAISETVSQILHQHLSSNQNILHVCCSSPALEGQGKVDCLVQDHCTVLSSDHSSNPTEEPRVDVAVLDLLLKHSLFAPEIVPMLKERDAHGYTPFMTSIVCHNFKAAMYILNFVESNKDNSSPRLRCSLKDMIFPEAFNGVTPLHALSITCTENLPPSGLGNSLTVTNLPSSYTPRILLKLFQGRYPSAYRATIPPTSMDGRKHCCGKSRRQKIREKCSKGDDIQLPKKPPAKRLGLLTATTSTGPSWNRRYGDGGGRIPIVGRRESLTGMVTFADPRELRQALVEMDHHMVSSEMTAPEGGLASLVQHVLHVKLSELENDEAEKVEMEVGVCGGVYNVSSVEGQPRILPKSQTSGGMERIEDQLICKLFHHLLSYPEIATGRNKEDETTLAFLVNNSRWIKYTSHQNTSLRTYGNHLLEPLMGSTVKRETVPQPETTQSPQDNEAMTEIKLTNTANASMLESNLLAQLDDISSSFQNIVDTLTTLEKRCSVQEQQPTQQQAISSGNFKVSSDQIPPVSGCTVTSAVAFNKPSVSASVTEFSPNESSSENLPVLIQLAQSWPSVAATVLGFYPTDTALKDTDELMSEHSSSGLTMMESSTLDSFVHELLLYVNEAVVVSFVETIVTEMNKHATYLTLDMVLGSNLLKNVTSPRDVAFSVGLKFLRSVIRQLAVHLSRSGLSYVDLQSRIGSGALSNNSRHGQSDSANFMRKVKMILKSFSWLSVHELIQAAEATVLPVREGVAKPQARSTGSSVSNGLPNPNGGFRGVRWSNVNPGIRVSGPHDTSGRPPDPLLRTAYRLNENRSTMTKSSCRGVRLANITEGSTSSSTNKKPSSGPLRGSPFELSRALGKKSSLLDSDSDSEDEMDQIGVMLSEADSDMEIDEADQQSVSMATGITHDHPYAWALDGRVMNLNEAYNAPGNVYISVVHLATDGISPRSVHTGNCYLTRMFSRIVKETLDLMTLLSQDTGSAGTRRANDIITPVLTIGMVESRNIQNSAMLILEKSWLWLAGVLDVVEGQLRMGKYFDTKRYLATLQRPEEADLTVLTRSMASVSGATPEEYLMFLLRAHHNEHKDALPVLDMLCYEHTVYVLDAFIYSMTHWPSSERILTRSISSVSSVDGEVFGPSFSQTPQPEPGPSSMESRLPTNTESKRRRRQNHERKLLEKFFGMDVMQADKDTFLNSLHDTVQQKFPKVPKASWEVFTHNVTVTRQKSVNETNTALQRESECDSGLPTTFSDMAKQTYSSPLVLNWSPNQALDRWKISVDLFSRLFLADGPGAERDSFLAARAGVAGRLARFRRTTSYLRDSVTSDSQQVASHHHHYHGYGGLGSRLGTTLSLSIKRQRILEDTFRILGEMSSFHYSNLRIKFEGEDGSGPGVNRGFFAAVANALKSDEKLPPETTALLHEAGKLPEQSGFYAPKPFAYLGNAQDGYLKSRRQKMFTAIGRFMGLSLWFNNTVPLNFSRHVVKFLLEREVSWEDLAFFNADLFEGLSRMIIDGTHPLMTPECFQATYCCHFETSVGGTTEELFPGGSQIPVTPDNIYSYVRLYATKVMIGCVESELRAMRSGLHDIIPSELLSSLTPEDFQLLLSGGTTDVDINRLRSVITFSNSNGCSIDILEKFKRWFWSIVQNMTPLQRQQLLYFCTGSAVLPAVADRRDPDQDLNITIDVVSGNTKMLPMATTCGQRMSIPLYSSKKILKRKLLQAIQCQSYGLG